MQLDLGPQKVDALRGVAKGRIEEFGRVHLESTPEISCPASWCPGARCRSSGKIDLGH